MKLRFMDWTPVPFLDHWLSCFAQTGTPRRSPISKKQLASEGLILLFSVPWPPQGLYAKREIRSVDELKGLKFRTYNAMIGRIAALAGSVPTQIEVPDLPTAFATGRVDVMITSASTGVDTKSQDYLTHYIDTQAWLPRNIVIVNKDAFDMLSAAEKEGAHGGRQGCRRPRLETVDRRNDRQDASVEGRRHQGAAADPGGSESGLYPKLATPSLRSGRNPPARMVPQCWRHTGSK